MSEFLRRSIDHPIRERLTYSERWDGPDRGFIWCWEDGRQRRTKEPELAERAMAGELVSLMWKRGSLRYLAQWQGIRGEDLELAFDEEHRICCTKTNKTFVFKRGIVPENPDEETE